MTITRLGATQKYAAGWEVAFGGKKKQGTPSKSRARATAKKKVGPKGKKPAGVKKAAKKTTA